MWILYINCSTTSQQMFHHQQANVPPPARIVSYDTHQLTNQYRTIPRPPPSYDTHQLTNQYCTIPKLRAIFISTSHLGQKQPLPCRQPLSGDNALCAVAPL